MQIPYQVRRGHLRLGPECGIIPVPSQRIPNRFIDFELLNGNA